jgi:hypothetical protein
VSEEDRKLVARMEGSLVCTLVEDSREEVDMVDCSSGAHSEFHKACSVYVDHPEEMKPRCFR